MACVHFYNDNNKMTFGSFGCQTVFSCTDCRVTEMIMTTKTVAYLSAERAVRVNTDTPTEVS